MRNHWWKILAVILLFYVVAAGFLVPLSPGIVHVAPNSTDAGRQVTIAVETYNTAFDASGSDLRAWLKLTDQYVLSAEEVRILSSNRLRLNFIIPPSCPLEGQVHAASLVLDDAIHGAFVMPDAVFIRDCSRDGGTQVWDARITGLHHPVGFKYPFRNILHETIRNAYFHIPMWFGMIILLFASAWSSIRYIRSGDAGRDMMAVSLASAGTLFGILGLLTGMIWSKYTWGAFWSWDIKQNTAAIAVLIYLAYFVLRSSITDPDRKARVGAAYNVFACAMLIPLLFVIPRMTDSLHPGSGGNPALGGEDLDHRMRMVFYPAVIGWTLLGYWIATLRFRILRLEYRRIYGV